MAPPQCFYGRTADFEVFGVHRMPSRILVLDGQERTGTHMKRYLLEAEAARLHPLDQFGREMQSCRGCGYGTFEFRIDRLIARVVDLLALAVEIGRNRNTPEVFEQLAEGPVDGPFEADDLLASVPARAPRTQMLRAPFPFETDLDVSLLPFLEVPHDAAPLATAFHGEGTLVVGRRVRFETEDLDTGSRGFVHDDSCADHLRVVEHEKLPCWQHVADVAEMPFGDLSAAPHEQLRGAPLAERELGDPSFGQIVVVVVYVDMSLHCAPKVRISRVQKQIYLHFAEREYPKTKAKVRIPPETNANLFAVAGRGYLRRSPSCKLFGLRIAVCGLFRTFVVAKRSS